MIFKATTSGRLCTSVEAETLSAVLKWEEIFWDVEHNDGGTVAVWNLSATMQTFCFWRPKATIKCDYWWNSGFSVGVRTWPSPPGYKVERESLDCESLGPLLTHTESVTKPTWKNCIKQVHPTSPALPLGIISLCDGNTFRVFLASGLISNTLASPCGRAKFSYYWNTEKFCISWL